MLSFQRINTKIINEMFYILFSSCSLCNSVYILSGVSKLLVSLGHTGRRGVCLGPHIKYTNTNENKKISVF